MLLDEAEVVAAGAEGDAKRNRLEATENQRLLSRMLARHAATVEQHEVQHRIDYADETFAPPSVLFDILGIERDSELARAPETLRIAYELSAYTAELARDPDWAKVNLALLAEHLYDGSGGAEGVSAILILDGLAKRLGKADAAGLATKRPVEPHGFENIRGSPRRIPLFVLEDEGIFHILICREERD